MIFNAQCQTHSGYQNIFLFLRTVPQKSEGMRKQAGFQKKAPVGILVARQKLQTGGTERYLSGKSHQKLFERNGALAPLERESLTYSTPF